MAKQASIRKIDDLIKEVESRRSQKQSINRKIDDFCQKYYGIVGFSQLVDDYFVGEKDGLNLCLSRQVITPNIEHVAAVMFAKWLTKKGVNNAKAVPTGFVRDSFSGKNTYKRSLLASPIIVQNGPDKVLVRNEKFLQKRDRGKVEGRLFSEILTKEGLVLPEYHMNMWNQAFPTNGFFHLGDVSDFFEMCLRICLRNDGRKPNFVYVEKDGYNRKVRIDKIHLNGESVRPPAEWFYTLYFLTFINGDRALLSTVDDNEQVNSWFADGLSEIEKETGLRPLIIDIPVEINHSSGYRSELLEVNPKIFNENWESLINFDIDSDDLFECFECFEKQIFEM